MNGWRGKDTLIVVILAVVGAAVGIGVGASHEHFLGFINWLNYRTSDALTWAIIGFVAGTAIGLVARLISK